MDEHGKSRTYFADFFVTSISTFVDTKNMWVLEKDREKLRRVAEQNPDKKYFVADGDFLRKLGIV